MIFHFILNPKSGRSPKQIMLEDDIKEACMKRQLSYHIYYTTCAGDAIEYVKSMLRISSDRQRFICVGGDGTINELANSAPENPNAEFGVIPSGSGNDFVRNFTNTKLFSDINAQIDGTPLSIDLIKYNDDYSANMINIGFDCAVVREAERFRSVKWLSPSLSYILGVISGFFKKFGTKMRLVFDDGEVIDRVMTLTAIGNGKFCGGGFMSCPKALLTDGLMDVCAINKISRFTFIKLVGAYKSGTFLENESAMKVMEYKRVPHFKMEFESPIPICIDGEIKGAKTIDFSVVKNGFNFVIPKGCELKYKENE